VVEVAVGLHDGDVIGRQPNVGVRATVVLLDVGLEVVGLGDQPETWRQRREGGECHVIAAIADLSRIVVPHRDHNLESRKPRRITGWTLGVAVVFLVQGTSLILDVVVLVLLTLHDPMDAAWRSVLVVIVKETS
jgi:hypothetical protein